MRSKPPKTPSKRPTTPIKRTILISAPTRKYPAGKEPRITDKRSGRHAHQSVNHRIRNYLLEPRRNYYKPDPELWHELGHESRDCLYANDIPGRLRFIDIVERHLESCPSLEGRGFFFVTVCPGRFVSSLRDGRQFVIAPLKKRVAQLFNGLNYVAFVDVALYRHWGPNGYSCDDHLSWHIHAIVWGITRKQLEKKICRARREPSLVPGHGAVHVGARSAERLEGTILYEMKHPMKEHWVNTRGSKDTFLDPDTGEITPSYRDQKRPMRTGQQVRLAEALIGRTLDKMIFGGGDGREIVRAAVAEALRPLELRRLRSENSRPQTTSRTRKG